MANASAGLLAHRMRDGVLEFFLVHPGGPFWQNKDEGAWSIPKGELKAGEDPLAAAVREFEEEIGQKPSGPYRALSPIKQKSGKVVHAWACAMDIDASKLVSNTFECEWPPGSGQRQAFPEVDRGGWFGLAEAKRKINPRQIALLEEASLR